MDRYAHRRFALLVIPLVAVFLLSALAVRATPTPSVLLDDTAFIAAPGFDHTAIQAFLDQQPGRLGSYQTTLDGKPAPAAHVISVASLGEPIEINPKVLLTLLEVAAGVVSTPDPAPATVQHPFPFINQPHVTTFESDLFAMGDLLRRSFVAYDSTAAPPIRLGNGRDYLRPPFPNAGTYALEVALGHLAPDSPTFERFIGTGGGSFRATFIRFFGDPASSISPQATLQATTPFLFKPFVGSFAGGSFLDHDTRSTFFVRFDGTSTGGYDGHDGTDYPMGSGNTIIAAADGIVVDVASNRNEPNVGVTWCIGYPYTPATGMVIKHTLNGVQYNTYYWHLASGAIGINPRTSQQFRIGDTISKGETVGFSGNTGCSTGAHLHFGVQRSGQSTDPYGWCGGYADPYTNFSEVLWAEAMTNPSPCSIIQNPDGYIDTPTHNAIIGGIVPISGWAKVQGSTIDRVEIWIDGQYRGNATYGIPRLDIGGNYGYQWEWDTTTYASGSHSIQAKAIAANGGSAFFPQNGLFTIQVNVQNPDGYLDAPTHNAIIGGTVLIGGWAKVQGSTIDRVEIWIDGQYRGNATYGISRLDIGGNYGYQWEWDTTTYALGSHSIQTKAIAANGGSVFPPQNGLFTIQVNVQNPNPVTPTPVTPTPVTPTPVPNYSVWLPTIQR